MWRQGAHSMAERGHDLAKKEESLQELRFTITSHSTHDFDLSLEVSVGHHLKAAIYRVGWDSAEEWRVSFCAPPPNRD